MAMAILIGGCAVHRVDLKASRPALLVMDVAPGYRDGVYVLAGESDELEFLARIYEPNPSKKWMPTISACLDSDDGNSSYCLHLSYDTALGRTYGRAKLSRKDGTMVANVTTPGTFSKRKKVALKLVKNGREVEAYVDGKRLDKRVLDYAPKDFRIGGSSGKLSIELLSPPPPPAPE